MDWKERTEMQSNCHPSLYLAGWEKHAMSNIHHHLPPQTVGSLFNTNNWSHVIWGIGHQLIWPTAKGSDVGWRGLLNTEVYQSEEGPDSKVWRYRGTICWCGFSIRSTGQWARGLLPSRLPCLPLSTAFYLQLSQLVTWPNNSCASYIYSYIYSFIYIFIHIDR